MPDKACTLPVYIQFNCILNENRKYYDKVLGSEQSRDPEDLKIYQLKNISGTEIFFNWKNGPHSSLFKIILQ